MTRLISNLDIIESEGIRVTEARAKSTYIFSSNFRLEYYREGNLPPVVDESPTTNSI